MNFSDVTRLPKHHRRTVLCLVTIIVLLIAYYDIWQIKRTVEYIPMSEILRPIWTGTITAALVGLFFLIFVPTKRITSQGDELRSHEINDKFKELLNETSHWENHANIGRWMRSSVLQKLEKLPHPSLNATILNPLNENLLELFTEYRSRRPDLSNETNTIKQIRIELLTTICTCAWYAKNTNVVISLGTLDSYSPDRIDGTADGFVVTLEGKREAAVYAEKGSRLNSILELRASSLVNQATPVDLSGFPKCEWSNISKKQIAMFLGSLGMTKALPNSIHQHVLTAMKTLKDPYPQ